MRKVESGSRFPGGFKPDLYDRTFGEKDLVWYQANKNRFAVWTICVLVGLAIFAFGKYSTVVQVKAASVMFGYPGLSPIYTRFYIILSAFVVCVISSIFWIRSGWVFIGLWFDRFSHKFLYDDGMKRVGEFLSTHPHLGLVELWRKGEKGLLFVYDHNMFSGSHEETIGLLNDLYKPFFLDCFYWAEDLEFVDYEEKRVGNELIWVNRGWSGFES